MEWRCRLLDGPESSCGVAGVRAPYFFMTPSGPPNAPNKRS